MPLQAYALAATFVACSILVGVLATVIASRVGGSRGMLAAVLPILGAFGAFYLIGHRWGVSIGPHVTVFGFQVALLGDLVIGFAVALLIALAQAVVTRARRSRAAGPGSRS